MDISLRLPLHQHLTQSRIQDSTLEIFDITVPFRRFLINKPNLVTYNNLSRLQLTFITPCVNSYIPDISTSSNDDIAHGFEKCQKTQEVQEQPQEKNFWGAVTLIIGTAVGPGMLRLPAATITSGPLPSTIAIILSWVYVISSILLVAELSFAVMEEDNLFEVSFTLLATKALGIRIGSFVALVYASLSFSLLVACVSGIGSFVSQRFPLMNPLIAHSLFPLLVGIILGFFPFTAIDTANRLLCLVMLFSITSLVAIGLFVERASLLSSFLRSSWSFSSILPAIPVTVLTLGFHVITPFICKIAGNTVNEARKAILLGGFVPLIMVLSWNVIVLGLAGTKTAFSVKDPISLLLSVNPSALTAVQGFAFTALANSVIGYAVSFPKQVIDTLELIFRRSNQKKQNANQSHTGDLEEEMGNEGKSLYGGLDDKLLHGFGPLEGVVMPLVLGVPVLIASFFRSTFSRALDFAGIYANCFLFGILPPLMAYIYQSKKKIRYVKNILY